MREKIINLLENQLPVEVLTVEDDSHKHEGHGGWQPGGETHFSVTIVSDAFEGVSRVMRHKKVYGPLSVLMEQKIHALVIKAYTATEWQERQE
jgi:BolA protein